MFFFQNKISYLFNSQLLRFGVFRLMLGFERCCQRKDYCHTRSPHLCTGRLYNVIFLSFVPTLLCRRCSKRIVFKTLDHHVEFLCLELPDYPYGLFFFTVASSIAKFQRIYLCTLLYLNRQKIRRDANLYVTENMEWFSKYFGQKRD